jgi:predicted DsbA family dithiol-disulfide isomerase
METPVIEVFADVWCTFAHVGLRIVDEHRRAAGREDVVIVVRAWPLELVNGVPMDPANASDHVRELREFVAPDLFGGFDATRFPTTTLPALALVARAYRTDPRTGERAAYAVRNALFEHGSDIADSAVLARLADDLAIDQPDDDDRAAVLTDWQQGTARGVIGSPHFFAAGDSAFCPSMRITKGGGGLTIHRDAKRLGEFLDQAFAELS